MCGSVGSTAILTLGRSLPLLLGCVSMTGRTGPCERLFVSGLLSGGLCHTSSSTSCLVDLLRLTCDVFRCPESLRVSCLCVRIVGGGYMTGPRDDCRGRSELGTPELELLSLSFLRTEAEVLLRPLPAGPYETLWLRSLDLIFLGPYVSPISLP